MDKRLILGVAAGVAALGVVALLSNKKSKKKLQKKAAEAKDNFKSKLQELQRKAKREYGEMAADSENAINVAKSRAEQWINKSTTS